MTGSTFAVGRYTPSEGSIVHRGRFSQDGQDRLILVCHGRTPAATYGCLQWQQGGGGAPPHLVFLCENGFAAICIDSGGDLTWGNDTSITAAVNAVAWARANGVCHPTKKVVVLGYSMGGLEANNYAHAHGSDVAGFVGEAPATDVDYFHLDPTYGPEIDAAYPSGYAGHSPILYAGGVSYPTRIFHASDDATVPISQSQAFVNAIASTDKTLVTLPNGGHANFWGNIDQTALLVWLNGLVY